MNLTSLTRTASPIGIIPADFSRLVELCHAANIRFRDWKNEESHGRDWTIIADEHDAYDTKGNKSGLGSRKFKKVCMLLDYIEFKHQDWSRHKVLAELIDLTDKKHQTLMQNTWQDMNDMLVKEGVPGYQTLNIKKSRQSQDFDL